MKFAFFDALIVTTHFDPEMAALADRHYSRRTVGAKQFLYSGRKIVIRDARGDVLFGWLFPDETMRMDAQTGYNCAIFRNESTRRSSEIILECEAIAIERWGTGANVHLCKSDKDFESQSRLLLQTSGMVERSQPRWNDTT